MKQKIECNYSEAISTQSKNNSIINRAENIPCGECSVFFPNGNVLSSNLTGHTITNPVISFKNGDCVVITAEMIIKNHILEILNQYNSLKLNLLSNEQKQLVKVQPENLIINGSTKIYYPNGNVLTGTLQGNSFKNVLLTFKNKETVLICQEVRIKNETVFKVIDKQFFDQSVRFKDEEIPRMQIGLVKIQQKCMISHFNGSSVQGQYSNGLIYDLQVFFKNGDKARLNECIQVNSAVLQALNQKTQYQKTDFDNQVISKVQVCDIQFLNEHSKYNNLCSVLYSNGNTLIGQLENGTLSNTILKFKNDDVVKILEPITIKGSAAFKLLQSTSFDSGLLEEFELNRVSQIEIKSDVHSDVQPQSNIQPSSANVILNMKSVKNLTSKATEQPKEETKTENGEQNPNQGNDQKMEKINSDSNAQNQTKEQTKQNLTGEQENCCKTEIENERNSKTEQNAVQMQNVKVYDQSDEKVIKDEKEQQKAPENQQMDQNNCQKAANEYNDDNLAQKDESQVTTTKSEQTQNCAHNNATNAIQQQEQNVETGKQQVPIQNTPLKETDSNLNTQPKHCAQEPQVKEECVNVSDKCTITYNGNSVQGQINGNTIQDLQIIFKNGDKAKLNDVIYISGAVLNILNQQDKFDKSDFSNNTNTKVKICDKQFSSVDNCSVLYPNGNILTGQLENGILSNPILKFKNDDVVKILEPVTIKGSAAFKLLQSTSFDSGLLEEFELNRVSQIEIKSDVHSDVQPQSNIQPSSANVILNMKSVKNLTSKATEQPKEETKTENGEQNPNQGNDQKMEKINSDSNAQNQTKEQTKQNLTGEQENCCKTEIENERNSKTEQNAVQMQNVKVYDQSDEKVIKDEKEQQKAPENQQMDQNNCQKADGNLAQKDESQVTTTKSEQTLSCARNNATNAIQQQEQNVETGKQQVPIQNTPLKETDSNLNTQPKHCAQEPQVKEECVNVSDKCTITYNGNSVQGQINGNTIQDLQIIFKNGDKAKLNDVIYISGAVLNILNQQDKFDKSDFSNNTNTKVKICDKQFSSVDNCSVLYPNGNILTGQLENGTLINAILKFKNDDVVKILEPITIKGSAAFKLLQSASFDSGLLEEVELNRVSHIEIKSDVHSDVQPQSNIQPSSANVILNMKSVKNLTSKATEQPKEETKTENGEQNPNQGNDQKMEKINSDSNAQNQTKEQTKQNLTGEQENCCKTEIENERNSKSGLNAVQMQNVKLNDQSDEKVIKDEKEQQKAPENQQMNQNNCQKAANEYNDDNLAQKDESQVTTTKSEQTQNCAHNNATNAIQQQEQNVETGKQQVPIQNTPLKETDSNLNTQPKHCAQEPQVKEECVNVSDKCTITYNGNSVQGQINGNTIQDLQIIFKNGDKAKLNDVIYISGAVLNILNQQDKFDKSDFSNNTNTKVKICDKQFSSVDNCSVLYPNGNILTGQLENGTLINAILKFKNDDVVKILEPITIKGSAAFKLLQSASFDSGLLEEVELNRVSHIEIKSDVPQPQSNTQPSSSPNFILNMKSVNDLTSKATEQPKEETKTENGAQNQNQGNDQKMEKINSDSNAQNQTKEQKKQNLTVEQENCCKTEIENERNSKTEQNAVQMQNVKLNDQSDEKVIKDEKEQQKAPENQQMNQNNCQKAANEYNDDNLAQKDESQVTTTKSEQTQNCAHNNATNAIQQQEQNVETGKQQVPIQNTPLKETDSNLNTQPKHCAQEPQVKEECVNVSDKCTITYNGNSVQGQINGNTIQDLQIIFKNGDKAKLNDVIYISGAVLNILNQQDKFDKSDFSNNTNTKVKICDKQFSSVDNCSVLYPNGNILTGQLENGILSNPILKFKNDDVVKILEPVTIKSSAAFKLLQSASFDSGLLEEFELNRVSHIEMKSDVPPQPQNSAKQSLNILQSTKPVNNFVTIADRTNDKLFSKNIQEIDENKCQQHVQVIQNLKTQHKLLEDDNSQLIISLQKQKKRHDYNVLVLEQEINILRESNSMEREQQRLIKEQQLKDYENEQQQLIQQYTDKINIQLSDHQKEKQQLENKQQYELNVLKIAFEEEKQKLIYQQTLSFNEQLSVLRNQSDNQNIEIQTLQKQVKDLQQQNQSHQQINQKLLELQLIPSEHFFRYVPGTDVTTFVNEVKEYEQQATAKWKQKMVERQQQEQLNRQSDEPNSDIELGESTEEK
ncbi:Hypothetical_protein [Hexamita inflata]|uniref:Hypothetical_protein n=1 Tax=Hexamita inflata TaxID=28002 RepID=A0ABP1HDF6_9EUKA